MLKGPTQDEGLGRIWFYPFLFCKEVDKLEKVSSLPLRHAYPPLGDREVFGKKKNNHIMSCRILHPYSNSNVAICSCICFYVCLLCRDGFIKIFFLNLIASKQVVK